MTQERGSFFDASDPEPLPANGTDGEAAAPCCLFFLVVAGLWFGGGLLWSAFRG